MTATDLTPPTDQPGGTRATMFDLVLLMAALVGLSWPAFAPSTAMGMTAAAAPVSAMALAATRQQAVRHLPAPEPLRAPATAQPVEPLEAMAPTPAAAVSANGIHRQAGQWQVDAQGMPRGLLVQQLAQLSGSRISVSPGLLDLAPAVTLHLRTPNLADAWRALLGDDFSHALLCQAQACQVWVTGLLRARATAGSATAIMAAAAATAATAEAAATVAPAAPAAPSGDAAAMNPAPTAPRADPPGLFPADPGAPNGEGG